jgi:hypothetical protein
MTFFPRTNRGAWALDDTCYHPGFKDCKDAAGKTCAYWRGGCQAAHLPPPAPAPKEAKCNTRTE